MKFWGKSIAIILEQMFEKMMCNNPYLDLVNMKAYINSNENLKILSGNEVSDVKQGP